MVAVMVVVAEVVAAPTTMRSPRIMVVQVVQVVQVQVYYDLRGRRISHPEVPYRRGGCPPRPPCSLEGLRLSLSHPISSVSRRSVKTLRWRVARRLMRWAGT